MGEHGPRPPFGTDVDHRPGMGLPQIPQEGNRQQRVADVLRADHEDPLPRRPGGFLTASDHRAKPTKKLNSCLLSYGA